MSENKYCEARRGHPLIDECLAVAVAVAVAPSVASRIAEPVGVALAATWAVAGSTGLDGTWLVTGLLHDACAVMLCAPLCGATTQRIGPSNQYFFTEAQAMFAKHSQSERCACYPWNTDNGQSYTDGILTSPGTMFAAAQACK